MERVLEAFERSVEAAIASGSLDPTAHAGPIEAARRVAALMDEPEWPMVNGKFDNVSPSSFLRYCQSLGITPDAVPKAPGAAKGGGRLAALQAADAKRRDGPC